MKHQRLRDDLIESKIMMGMESRELGELNTEFNILNGVHITEEEVLDTLKPTKMDKSLGPDQVYPRNLWEARTKIAGFLAEIFVSSIAI
eukprot:g45171.t1